MEGPELYAKSQCGRLTFLLNYSWNMLYTANAELGDQEPGVVPRGVLDGPEPLLAHQWSKLSPMSRRPVNPAALFLE